MEGRKLQSAFSQLDGAKFHTLNLWVLNYTETSMFMLTLPAWQTPKHDLQFICVSQTICHHHVVDFLSVSLSFHGILMSELITEPHPVITHQLKGNVE